MGFYLFLFFASVLFNSIYTNNRLSLLNLDLVLTKKYSFLSDCQFRLLKILYHRCQQLCLHSVSDHQINVCVLLNLVACFPRLETIFLIVFSLFFRYFNNHFHCLFVFVSSRQLAFLLFSPQFTFCRKNPTRPCKCYTLRVHSEYWWSWAGALTPDTVKPTIKGLILYFPFF